MVRMENPEVGEGEVEKRQQPLVAVAIDKDKGSQIAFKWTLDNLVTKGQTIMLIHVKHSDSSHSYNSNDTYAREVFLPFRCFCTRKEIQCKDIVLEDNDVAKGIIEFASQSSIEKLVVGAPMRSGFARFKTADISTSISKGAPEFCTVYFISNKGKLSSVRNASREAPAQNGTKSKRSKLSTFMAKKFCKALREKAAKS